MSYCQIITFKDGIPERAAEFRNAWGGCARIWSSLFDRYLKDPAIPYHNFLTNNDGLWTLAKRDDLPMFERAVHAATFDRAYIRREHFAQYVADLRALTEAYPVDGKVDHLAAWADLIESLDESVEAIGFYGTSVSENLWWKYDNEKDEELPQPLSSGFEVYDWLAELALAAQ